MMIVAALACAVSVSAMLAGAAGVAHGAYPRTVVSLTFDDGNANQLAAASLLTEHGMHGTFYVVSGYVGASGYLTRADLQSLAQDGHEIGGHTVNHPDLLTIEQDEARRQVCTDRNTLLSWGFSVRSFAYPFASADPATELIAQDCGYQSARLLGDLRSRFGCAGCPRAETVPPAAPFATRALDQVDRTWTLADLKAGVTNAERAGGWVQFTFHDVCASGCGDLNVTPTLLSQFLTWLAPRSSRNTVVQTVGDTVAGAVAPPVMPPVVPAPTGDTNGVANAGMEQLSAPNVPSCWMQGGWGANTPTFAFGAPAHDGAMAAHVGITGYQSGDAKLLPQFDLGQCSPSVTAGRSYSLRSWYLSSAVTQFAVYLRSDEGAWRYWTSSPWFEAASTWMQAAWTTPPIPSGYTGISFALSDFHDGDLVTDDVGLYDAAAAPIITQAARRSLTTVTVDAVPRGPIEVFRPMETAEEVPH